MITPPPEALEPVPARADGAPPSAPVAPYDHPQPVLDDGAVRLRPARAEDAPLVLAACQDPETQRWTTIPVPYGPQDAASFVRQYAPGMWAGQTGACWMITQDDDYCGAMDLTVNRHDRARAEVGFACAPWARGRGLTTAALRLVCAWGFGSLGIARIEWRAFAGNEGSRRVAERAGFTIEGLQRSRLVQRGERRDAWVGSLLPGDAPAAR